jgi:diacylglycerol kinase family enzyme
VLIIINNFAAKARRSWPIIKKQLDAANIKYVVHETTSPGDAITRTRAALRSGVENVVVVGGDGTLSEAAEGFFEFNSDPAFPPSRLNPAATLAIPHQAPRRLPFPLATVIAPLALPEPLQ